MKNQAQNMNQNNKLKLPNVTLVAMTSVNIRETIEAMKYSMRGIEFGDVVLITHKKPWCLPKEIRYSHTSKLACIDDFNYKMVYELGEHINTEFALIVHSDGYVVHPEMWRDEFLDYDYIGSPWPMPSDDDPLLYRDIYGNISRVGNCVGIRSKRLMDYPKQIDMKWEPFESKGKLWYNEDIFICCRNKHLFEEAGMKFAPLEVAKYYSHEHMIPEIDGITPFAFHQWRGTNAQYPKFDCPSLWERMKRVRRKLLGIGQ